MTWLQDMAKAGANMYTFHLECPCFEQPAEPRRTEAVAKLAAAVREAGMHAGVALRPSTPVEAVMPYLEAGDFDMVRGSAYFRSRSAAVAGPGSHPDGLALHSGSRDNWQKC